jgi:sec-independent protein translocase protein TatA
MPLARRLGGLPTTQSSTGGVPLRVLWFRRFKVTLMGIGAPELIVIAIIIVILFGGKRLPELGSGVGKAIANFKKGYRESSEIDISPKDPSNSSAEGKGPVAGSSDEKK